jgi:diguanylate cyclase (GGDEF)-like protein
MPDQRSPLPRPLLRQLLLLVTLLTLLVIGNYTQDGSGFELVVNSLYLVPILLTAEWLGLGWAIGVSLLVGGWISFISTSASPFHGVGVIFWGVCISLLVDFHRQVEAKLRRELERSRLEASLDGLTGLQNWRSFKQGVEHGLRDFPGQTLSLLLIDIDYFKVYNDTFGHPAGDQLLRSIAAMISSGFKSGTVVYRFGGEEFAVILHASYTGEAVRQAEEIRGAVQSADLPGVDQMPDGYLSLSIGVATFPFHAFYSEQLIQRADEALYQAKANGRNQVVECSK